MTELLAKTMAQILSILALSSETAKERRISGSIQTICSFVANYGSRNIYEEVSGKGGLDAANELPYPRLIDSPKRLSPVVGHSDICFEIAAPV